MELDQAIKKSKVLIVEDMLLNQLLMKTLLEDLGFDLSVAANGKIAIEKLAEDSYDLILMDLQMPVMDGFEATEYIRNKMNLQIPIIALTADVNEGDIKKCMDVGMNDFIAKPVDEKILYSKIFQHLKKSEPEKNEQQETILTPEPVGKYIDLTYLKVMTKNNDGRLKELIEIYLEETPLLVKNMQHAIDSKDWALLKNGAHSILPSFSTMGMDDKYEKMANEIQEIAINLIKDKSDGTGKKENILRIGELFLKIEEVLARSCQQLKEVIDRMN